MTTRGLWEAFDRYHTLYQSLETWPVTYVPKTREFIFVKEKRRLITHIVFVLAVSFALGEFSYCPIRLLFDGKYKMRIPWLLIPYAVFFYDMVFGIVSTILLHKYGDDIAQGFNQIVRMQRAFVTGKKGKEVRKSMDRHEYSNRGNLISILLKWMLPVVATYPLMVTSTCVTNIDPLGVILLDIFGEETMKGLGVFMNLALFSIRCILVAVQAFEVLRHMAFWVLVGGTLLMSIGYFKGVLEHSNFPEYKRLHPQLLLGFERIMVPHQTVAGSGLFLFFTLLVICAFVTLKMFHALPFPLYIAFAVAGFFALCACLLIIRRFCATLEELADNVLYKKRKKVGEIVEMRELKYWRRFVRAQKPLDMYGGIGNIRLLKLGYSTVKDLGQNVVDYTITLLLSVEVNH